MHINGIRVHERGCPDAHTDETRSCAWCGSDFSPEDGGTKFCSSECCNSFNDYPNEDDLDVPDDEILVEIEGLE